MLKRSMTRLAVALLGAGSVVSAAAMVGGSAHGVPANMCVNVKGNSVLQNGTANCDGSGGVEVGIGDVAHADSDPSNHAVAIGDNAEAVSTSANKSNAVSLGPGSNTFVEVSNKDSAVAHGAPGNAQALFGNKNAAVAGGTCATSTPDDTSKQAAFCKH